MTSQTGLESSKFHKADDDSTKVVNIDYKKVGHLNLEVLCSICQKEVHISQLFHHKKTHQAQAVLDYQRPWVEPIDMEKIAHRRKKLILKRRMDKYPEREREKIDCAVDLLKESLKIAPYFCIKSVSQSSVHIQEVSNPLIKAIAVCQDKNAIWNIDLEDVFVVLDNYGNRKGTSLLGLFDGSNGISAAQTASAELPLLLLDQLSHGDLSYQVSQAEKEVLDSFRTVFRADYIVREKMFTYKRVQSKKTQQNKYEWIHRAYAKSFWRMDRLLGLGRNEVSRVRWSSCAAAICLVETISNEKQEEPEVGETLPTDKKNIQEEEQELPERIRAKKRSGTEMGPGRGPEQQGEPLERINDKKEQNIVGEMETPLERVHGKEEQNFVEKTEDPLERKNDETEENIIEQREDPLERKSNGEEQTNTEERENHLGSIRDGEEQTNTEEREDHLESIRDGEEQTNTEEREDHLGSIRDGEEQTNTEEREDHLGSISDGEEQTNTEEREDHLGSISDGKEQTNEEQREDHLESISDEKEQNNTEQRVEPAEIINDEKEENVIEQRGDLLKRRKTEKEQGITQKKEESFEIINDKKEPYLMQEESQLPERISGTKEKIIMGSGTGHITGQQQEKPLETINDGKENNIGDNKQIAENKEIKGGSLLENNTSSDEVSVGLMHIGNIGNVHAVLCKNGKSYWLTKEHSTYSREEKSRVFQKGGYISSNEPKGLLEGLTKNTRGLGFHGNRKLKRSVIPVPHTITFPIDDSCQFLVLASNGLWEVLDKSEVVLLTLTMFSAYLEKYQDAQLKKRHSSSGSELPLDYLEGDLYSWYLNQDIFPERDVDQNLSQSNAQLSPPKHSISEKAIIKSDSFKENSVEEFTSSLESTLSSITSSSEDTETLPPRSGSEEILDQNTELALESDDSSQTSEDTETNSRTFYDLAAKYISKHLVKAALKAGSRDNITVLVALLNGCDKIPIYVQNI